MALMKTGRRGGEPTTKAQQEVKVTAKKPVNEPPNQPIKKYSWEDVDKIQQTKERNKAAKSKYESDLASYNKAMKLYTEGPEDTEVKDGIKLPAAKLSKGQTATFSKATERYSAEKANKLLQSKIKSGEVVSIDDPSLAPETRKVLAGVYGNRLSSDIYGKTAGKIYIDKKSPAAKVKTYKEAYGEDFNPEEFRASQKSGKFDEYSKKKGYSGRAFVAFGGNEGYYSGYGVPEKPSEPKYEKEVEISSREMPSIPGLRTLKPKPTGELSISPKKEEQAPTWEEPTGGIRYRTKYSKPKNVSLGEIAKSQVKALVTPGKQLKSGLIKSQGKERLFQGKIGREGKEFKAYYGTPSSISGSDRAGMTKDELASERESLKKAKSELKAGDRSNYRKEIKNIKKDIKATKLAERYFDKNLEARSVYNKGKEEVVIQSKEKPSARAYKPELGESFYEYRKSTDNPANKNTIFSKIKSAKPR